eukprot:TRINITY_DN91118_c0_g1_i1.p1 TRINITY_DN91118_c0_g1~~TRINITY_DN91118_c0_g1_i1.p1  ORF type:complete len:260 (-),score=25.04 TRINITY_DN91118_c0_g1_i1:212-991(-)
MKVSPLFFVLNVAVGHYVWLSEPEGRQDEGIITFGEVGAPGPAMFLNMIADKVSLDLANATSKRSLQLAAHNTSAGAELVAKIDSVPPFSLYAAATFGIFRGNLLKYYASADMVTHAHDWRLVEDWRGVVGLDLTIRDPWMGPETFRNVADSPTQCALYTGLEKDGDACVIAVIRYNGKPLTGQNVTLSTFTSDGKALRETTCTQGVCPLKVPLNASLYAKANYREASPGTYDGKEYQLIDHWATTYARIYRSPSVLFV